MQADAPVVAPRLIGHRAHQQTARGSTRCKDATVTPLLIAQEIRGVNKVVERVLLVHQSTILIPILAHIRAAANVCGSNQEPAIHQTHRSGIELRIGREPVRAVTLNAHGMLAIAGIRVLTPRKRNRNSLAITARRPGTRGFVLIALVPNDWLHLSNRARRGCQVNVNRGAWRDHRRITDAHRSVRRIHVLTKGHGVCRLIRWHYRAIATSPRNDANTRIGINALQHGNS